MNEVRIGQIKYHLKELSEHGLGDSDSEATRFSLENELSTLLDLDTWWNGLTENDKIICTKKYFPKVKNTTDLMIKTMYKFEIGMGNKIIK